LLTASEVNPRQPSETTEPVIQVEGISVRFRVPRERYRTFKEYAIRTIQGRIGHEEFWALQNINFEVRPREVFGIIGRNGAGKSTLLRVVAGVFKPTRGRVRVQGRVAPLLELGAGFHPELTGRENIFLNGALLGYSKAEMQRREHAILDFAEIDDFIDAPLRTYSTGMVARLGFAVATSVRPDVLIVDEVLSVGDAPFQEKCKARIETFRRQGSCILLVAHSMGTILEVCDRALWLSHGEVRAVGEADIVAHQYHTSTLEAPAEHA
jgi:ABC-2 type transport system ATP-binding protein/lipopolysaccharide transport system ATP-binding protein